MLHWEPIGEIVKIYGSLRMVEDSGMGCSDMEYNNMGYSDMGYSDMEYSNMEYNDMRYSDMPDSTFMVSQVPWDILVQLV